jgi:hypothetical protein
VISANWASPGYLPSPIEAGDWVVEVDVHRILPPGNINYQITVFIEADETKAPPNEPPPDLPIKQKRRGPGWYTGDLHGHTFHSDGVYSPAEYLAVAHQRGYDFVAITDHNTFSAVPQARQLASDGLTLIGGVELTTFNGHALALGLEDWTEWRVKDGATMSAIATALQDAGAVYIIAHPKTEGHPFCAGCRWAHSDMLPGPARHVEIWNRVWQDRSHNQDAVRLFYQWLNTGYRMVATAGTDTHGPMPAKFRIAANRVYARDNTQAEILAAIKRGHCYVSSGPDLAISAISSDGSVCRMGDIAAPGPLRISCGWDAALINGDAKDVEACLISQGREIDRWRCSDLGEAAVTVQTKAGNWFVLELRDKKNRLHALSNPVYVGRNGEHWH